MFWPIVLPFQVTCWVLGAVIVTLTAVAPLLKWRRGWMFLAATFFCGIAFIPSCTLIQAVIDTQRFGVFEHDSYEDVNDFRVQRFMPPAAKAITVQKYSSGFRARYSVTEDEVARYMDEIWSRYGDVSVVDRKSPIGDEPDRFDDLGWPPLDGAIKYDLPFASNGAGATIWHSPSRGVAYERAGYW